MSNQNLQNKDLSEEALLGQFKQFQENAKRIQQHRTELNFHLKQKENELEVSKQKAIDNFGTADVSELRNIYSTNLNHNRNVIPAALEETTLQLQRINDVLKNLGIQS